MISDKTTPEQVMQWSTEQLWNTFKHITRDNPEYKQEFQIVKNGINLKFPIHYIIQGWYNTWPRSKTVTVEGHGRTHLTNFLDEIELRNEIMQDIIIENIETNNITEPRIQE